MNVKWQTKRHTVSDNGIDHRVTVHWAGFDGSDQVPDDFKHSTIEIYRIKGQKAVIVVTNFARDYKSWEVSTIKAAKALVEAWIERESMAGKLVKAVDAAIDSTIDSTIESTEIQLTATDITVVPGFEQLPRYAQCFGAVVEILGKPNSNGLVKIKYTSSSMVGRTASVRMENLKQL